MDPGEEWLGAPPMSLENGNCCICMQQVRNDDLVKCIICLGWTHIHCLPEEYYDKDHMKNYKVKDWYCRTCNMDILPFNNIESESLFQEIVNGPADPNYTNLEKDNLTFDLFNEKELLNINSNEFLADCDPDINFLNEDYDMIKKCKYYSLPDLKKLWDAEKMKTNYFTTLHLNIRSIPKNLDKLEQLMKVTETDFDCIGISETWLKDHNAATYNLSGYEHFYKTRAIKTGGGVSLFQK